MAMLKVARGVLTDIPVFLLARPGGALVDDRDWVDGSTVAEWPVITVRNKATQVDVTDDWIIDIEPYDIGTAPIPPNLPAGSIKHVDTETGIWRRTTGTYNLRTLSDLALPFGEYQVGVTYDIGSGAFTEWGDIELIAPGDVAFGDLVFGAVSTEDITVNLNTSMEEEDLQRLLTRASNRVQAMIRACGVDPDSLTEIDGLIVDAIIQFAQSYIVDFDASAGGYVTSRKEGRKEVRYSASTAKLGDGLRNDAMALMEEWCISYGAHHKARGGVIERRVRGANTTRGGAVSSLRESEADF